MLTGCVAACVAGCVTGSRPHLAPRAGAPPSATPPSAAGALPADVPAPWRLADGELATQRLYRIAFDGPDGEGSARLTLRLAAADRYRITAVDPLGRPVWQLAVEGEAGLWLDHRGELFCRLEGSISTAALPLSPFELPGLPLVLAGRPPLPPAGPVTAEPRPGGDRIEYRDAAGRRWTVDLAEPASSGEVAGWTLWSEGEPIAWLRWLGDEAILSQRPRAQYGRPAGAAGVQVRWRLVVAEPLGALPEAPEVPPGYRDACAEL